MTGVDVALKDGQSAARRWMADALAAVIVAGVLCLRAAAPFETEARPPDWPAYGLMILMGGLLLVRRRFPVGVLIASSVILLAYYNLGFGAVGAVWPMAPALFNAALLGEPKAASWTAAFVAGASSFWRLFFDAESGDTLSILSDILTEVVVAVAAVLAGAMIRNHRQLQQEVRQRERAVAAERDAAARSRLTEQRLHIAREVHDIVAHSLAGIGVQARVADEVLDSDAAEARRSIRSIIDATADAMGQLRQTVGGLRSGAEEPPSVKEIVNSVYGIEVDLVVEGSGPPPDGEVDAVVRAIVRESLTNVLRHAHASHARVTLTQEPDLVKVEITDDGQGVSEVTEGHGIRGMRERVVAVGGTIDVGPLRTGGWRISATMPR